MINLQQVIDDVVTGANQKEKRKPTTSPSNLGNCLRKCILREIDAPHTEFTAQQLRVFRVGYLFERFVEEALEKSGLLFQKQVYVTYKGMSGTLDFLMIDEANKEIVITDCKSVHSGKFDYLDKKEVDEGYAIQQTFYWLGLREACQRGEIQFPHGYSLSPTVWLFYVEKECLLTKQIAINTEEWTGNVDSKLSSLEFARTLYKEKNLLPLEYEAPIWECFSVQKSKHKVPRPIGVKVWCPYLSNCPNKVKALEDTKKQIEGEQNV